MIRNYLLLAGLSAYANALVGADCSTTSESFFGEIKRSLLGQSEEDMVMCITSIDDSVPEVSQATLDEEASLYKWNAAMSIMHFLSAGVMLYLSLT